MSTLISGRLIGAPSCCNNKMFSQSHISQCQFLFHSQVRSTLENALGNVGVLSFYVHPVGVVMEL